MQVGYAVPMGTSSEPVEFTNHIVISTHSTIVCSEGISVPGDSRMRCVIFNGACSICITKCSLYYEGVCNAVVKLQRYPKHQNKTIFNLWVFHTGPA